MFSCEAWKPCTREGVEKLEAVQRRAVRMAGGQGSKSYREACRDAGLNTVEEQLDEADMVRVFRIMNGDDKIDKTMFWTMEEPLQGEGNQEKCSRSAQGCEKEKLRLESPGSLEFIAR